MIVTIYPSECILFKGDYVCSRWIEHRFTHRETKRQLTDNGFIKVRNEMPPIRINIESPMSRLTTDRRRLTLPSGHDTDAETVLHMARIGKHGMKVLPNEKQDRVLQDADPQPSIEAPSNVQGTSKA